MSKEEYILELEEESFDLIAKITWLLKEHDLWDEDNTFTFGDGDRWSRFDPDYELELSTRKKEEPESYV
jgi:hypothetical protein